MTPILARMRAAYHALTESRTSPEDPRTNLADPASWLWDAWGGGGTSDAGIAVSERSAMSYSAAFACINVLAKDLAQLPTQVFERKGEDRVLVRDHPVYRLLHDRPNDLMTPFTFKQTLHAHVVGWGNGYAEIESTKGGRVTNLWPLLPDRTHVEITNGVKTIVTTLPDGQRVGLPAERVLHIPGLGFDGTKGYSVIGLAKQAIGAGMAAEKFSALYFQNGAIPALTVTHPGRLSPDARKNLRESWKSMHEGLNDQHRMALLEEGMTVAKIGIPQDDAQFIETVKFGIEQTARFFDIPLMRLHSTTAITSWGTGLEQWNRGYLVYTLRPWLTLWEESLNWALLSTAERQTHYIEFLDEALLQGDTAAQTQQFKELWSMGVLNSNQIAQKLNLPNGGPAGDEYFIPLNFQPRSLALDPPDPTAAGDGTRALRAGPKHRQQQAARQKHRLQRSQVGPLTRAAERYVRQETQAVRAAIRKASGDRSVADFQRIMDQFYRTLPAAIRREMSPMLRSYFTLLQGTLEDEVGSFTDEQAQHLERALQQYEDDLIATHVRFSTDSLRRRIADATGDGLWDDLAAHMDEWDSVRAERIGDLTATSFMGTLSRVAYGLYGFTRLLNMKMSGVQCDVCDPLDGQVAHGTPPNHTGCSCVLVAG